VHPFLRRGPGLPKITKKGGGVNKFGSRRGGGGHQEGGGVTKKGGSLQEGGGRRFGRLVFPCLYNVEKMI